jgi:enoyl-CoA hydratase
MSEEVLLVERDGPVATLTLNRPQAMNALSSALRRALAETVEALEADPDVHILILTGAGEKAFSAGLDLKELGSGGGVAEAAGSGGAVKDPVRALAAFRGPIIGAINGVAITGGFELALACDVLIGTPNTRFADTHGRVGIMPGWGLSQKLSRLIGIARAKEMSLTGNFIDAAQACAWGLLNRVVPAAELLPVCRQLAADMATMDPDFQKAYKQLIDDGYDVAFREALALETERNRAGNAAVSGADIEARRRAVMERGRTQKA